MLPEISSAVLFIASILKRSKKVSNEALCKFIVQLYRDLEDRYQHHWFENIPDRGSAYRCIRNTTRGGLDPRVCKAGAESGISRSALTEILPSEFIVWVDPHDVSYKVGEYGCLTKVTKDELVKVHRDLKGYKLPMTPNSKSYNSPKKNSRSSPITIKSVHQNDEIKLSTTVALSGRRSASDDSSDSGSTPPAAQNEESGPTTSSESSSIFTAMSADDVSLTNSMFDQSLQLFDNSRASSTTNYHHLDSMTHSSNNEFDTAFRLSSDAAAINAAAAAAVSVSSWNQLSMSALAAAAASGNFWHHSQSNGFNDYISAHSFNNNSNNMPANAAIYALN